MDTGGLRAEEEVEREKESSVVAVTRGERGPVRCVRMQIHA